MKIKLCIAFLSLPFFGKAQLQFNVDHYDTDTVKCIMLVADTCNCHHGQKTNDMSEAFKWEGFAFYIKGYHTTETFHCEYLDKKPLSKNIIVWMSKDF